MQRAMDVALEPYHLTAYTAGTIVLAIYVISKVTSNRYKLAPGPFRIPILGNVLRK